MTDAMGVPSWERDQKLVLHEMGRLSTLIELLRTDVGDLKVEIAMLKIKSGLWGLTAGTVPVIIALGIKSMG
jgi:hypothetical protein